MKRNINNIKEIGIILNIFNIEELEVIQSIVNTYDFNINNYYDYKRMLLNDLTY